MNFVLVENTQEKINVIWENNFENLPSDTIAFTYYQQDNIDENGMVASFEYRIGTPIKFVLGDIYIELESNLIDSQEDDIYCLYIHDEKKLSQQIKRIIKPINKNTTLVSNFSELEDAFSIVAKKEHAARKQKRRLEMF